MAHLHLEILSEKEIQNIHDASMAILGETGVRVHHDEILQILAAENGCTINAHTGIVLISEKLVMECVGKAAKRYILYGRDGSKTARFGYGDQVLMSSPGQYNWIDFHNGQRRDARMQDASDAIRLGDALDNISIVGAMAQPRELSDLYRDVVLTAELVKGTAKPTRCWVKNGKTAAYIMEIYRAVAGGEQALRQKPMVEAFLEPISPLQMPHDGLDILREFTRAGQPVSIGPMAMTSGTAPATLAGTLAQENAEILAGIVITQLLAPGTPVLYGGIPHIMDPRTSICSFGAPEQGMMAAAMVQIARFYGFASYVNVGLTDAKLPDAQAGIEKSASMVLGALAGADTFGHCGICGTDHAASLLWLAMDNEIMGYVKRLMRGFDVTPDTLATEVVKSVGPAGNFLAEEHTVDHFRKELWLPPALWTRQSYQDWDSQGATSFSDRLHDYVQHFLKTHTPEPLEEGLSREIDSIIAAAGRELGNIT
jgi:trimethylamine---corrinoid protein Co-methyltransferase